MDFSQYQTQERRRYQAFADAVAHVLRTAITQAGGYRLQMVPARAKDPRSLHKRLVEKNLVDSTELEARFKDLAGVRAIFYTNNADVEKLIGSGLIQANFQVLETKRHTPGVDLGPGERMYTAVHYVVAFTAERLALAEYADFAGLRCEIQLVNLLNHGWSELEHDIIYKPGLPPEFAKALASIRARFHRIAADYLLRANYELDRAVADFERLQQGKEAFEGGVFTRITQATDNNARFDAITSIAEHVLPSHDDPGQLLVDLVPTLIAAAQAAREAPVTPIVTPFGDLPGKTFEDLAELIARILTQYRYFDVPRTLDVARQLFSLARSPAERKSAIDLGHAVAKHDLDVWKDYGPAVQRDIVDYIARLPDAEMLADSALLVELLETVLGSEATNATWSSGAVALGRGAVVGSDDLARIRDDALTQLTRLYAAAEGTQARRRIASAMWQSAQPPYGPAPTAALTGILTANATRMIDFSREALDPDDLALASWLEHRVQRAFHNFRAVRPELADDPQLQAAIAGVVAATTRFRHAADALPDFADYKLLVGFESIYPIHWDERVPDTEHFEAYRRTHTEALLARIGAQDVPAWLERLERFAQTRSDDRATFMHFGPFLKALGQKWPQEIFDRLEGISGALEGHLAWFVAGLLDGPMAQATRERIAAWLEAGAHLDSLPWLLMLDAAQPAEMYRAMLDSARTHGHDGAVANVLDACLRQFSPEQADTAERIDIFLEALHLRVAALPTVWTQSHWWFAAEILKHLDEDQAQAVLALLVPLPQLDEHADHLVATVGKSHPAAVLSLIDGRLAHARDQAPEGYHALPYELHHAAKLLTQQPDALLAAARRWYDADEQSLDWTIKRLIESVFGDFPDALQTRLSAWLSGEDRADALFALEVLSAFEGQDQVVALAKLAAARWGQDTEVADAIHFALAQEGMSVGIYGRARALQARRDALQAWLEDPAPGVRVIAAEEIRVLELRIAQEIQCGRDTMAARRLDYDEDPLDPSPPDPPPDDGDAPDDDGDGPAPVAP